MGARETALRVLAACRNNNAWADAGEKSVDTGIFHQVFEYRRN